MSVWQIIFLVCVILFFCFHPKLVKIIYKRIKFLIKREISIRQDEDDEKHGF